MKATWTYTNDNAVLRLELYELYKTRCYRCYTPQKYTDIEIDHIVPQSFDDDYFDEIRTKFSLSSHFNRHDPSNLAPICDPCNKRKNNKGFRPIPFEMDRLVEAESFRTKVIEGVQKFHKSGHLAKGLVEVTISDLRDPKDAEAVMKHAPALIQRLALLDKSLLEYEITDHHIIEIGGDTMHLRAHLSQKQKIAVGVLEVLFGTSLWTVSEHDLVRTVGEIQKRLDDEAITELEKHPYFTGDPGPRHTAHLGLEVEDVRLLRTVTGVSVVIDASIEIQQTRSVPLVNEDGDGFFSNQGDAYGFVAVQKTVSRPSFDNGEIRTTEYETVEWKELNFDQYA
ncbi:HNH endonuclease [Arthrobacter sp. B0490]|uniref:HNH endonuclease n=1 Tax=Arthrobacter sp. B0490 TaxID=2058891 RepID=UPI0015E432E6|nr:DUF1524 domain-containing protein [Arthrobacter sp. B0490]